jgi:phosphoribosylglycinamide formyltransferase-1
MKNIALFASGNGSNAQNIIEYFNLNKGNCTTPNCVVKRVICNRPTAYVLERAKMLDVPSSVLTKEELTTAPAPLLQLLEDDKIDIIVLAGYLLMIPNELTQKYKGRIINIHPSLLPAYGGKGMYGDKVHEAVINAGETKSGITIHLVDEIYDNGKTLFQAECPVMKDDTPDSLAQRIHKLEYTHFPRVIDEYIKNGLQ